MKKLLVCMIFIAFLVQLCPAAFTTSISTTGTYKNAYRWTGQPGADKILLWAQEVEGSILGTTAIAQTLYTPTNSPSGTSEGTLYYDLSEHKLKYRNAGAWVAIESGSAGNSLDGAYNVGSAVNVDTATVGLSASDSADVIALTVTQLDTGATVAQTIVNAGTGAALSFDSNGTGADILGSDSTWNITKAGVVTFVGGTTTGDVTITGSAADILFDVSDDELMFQDDAELSFGDTADIVIAYDNTSLNILGDNKDIRFGADGVGPNVTFFTEAGSSLIVVDEDLNALTFDAADIGMGEGDEIKFGDALGTGDMSISCTSNVLLVTQVADGTGSVVFSADGEGMDVTWFGDTAGSDMTWDENANTNGALILDAADIELGDADFIQFGDGADFVIHSTTGKQLQITGANTDETDEVHIGVDSAGVDLSLHGATASDALLWDASEDYLHMIGDKALFTLAEAGAANVFKVDATGAAGSEIDLIVLETSDGGIQLLADGDDEGDIDIDAEDNITITAADTITLSGATTIATGILTPSEVVTATNEIEITESGTVYALTTATEFVTTLPTAATSAGVTFKFILGAAPADADFTIVTDTLEDLLYGMVLEAETDTTEDGPTIQTGDTITFVRSVAVIGDWVEVTSDGTNWYVHGMTAADGGVTLTQED